MPPLAVQRILFPTDFSAAAEGAYRHAAWLADRFGAELHVLHVVEDESAPPRDWPDVAGTGHVRVSLADVSEDLGLPAPAAEDHAPYDEIEVVEAEVVGRAVPEAVLDYARDEEVDLVVMGTHGRRGWRRGVLGSAAEAVARRAPCPVLTVRPLDAPGQGEWPPSRVLLAADELPARGDHAAPVPLAARWAARLAVAYHAPLEIVHVTTPSRLSLGLPDELARVQAREREALLTLAEALRAEAEAELPVGVAVRSGDPAAAVRAAAEETRAHLLVVGTHGRGGAGRALLGSVAETLVRTAPCPVLVARDALADADRPAADAREARS
ncbi:universal stress protein [Rubrivirga litoralis]|uniref:Universal stress protein n=1 Tax=Rubrivirga litoralis TaxID=3075598 RepID=A0ABU3BNK2_9BACT|nr:universal stress protein [Rubrivirga sp. F394]MDT0630850.1 universal stress protein [Rubrivirga sp. F394]